MESPWTFGLIAIAIVTMLLSVRTSRAWLWLGLAALSFFASTLYLDLTGNREIHPIFTLACDALLCLAIFRWHKEDWEILVFGAYLVSVFSSVLMIGGFINEAWIYAGLLELANVAAMLCIGITGVADLAGKNESARLHPLHRSLHSSRRSL